LGSAITPKSKTNSSEILFLKRLLYLKASIDNESTLNTYSVPFEQEKRKELASPSQLRLNSNAFNNHTGTGTEAQTAHDQYAS
jgi:hypothetical protein